MGKFYLSMNLQSIGMGRKELQGNGLQENTRPDFHFMLVWTKDRIIWLSYCIVGEVVGLMWSGLEDKTANRWSDRSRRERGRVDWILPMWCWAVISFTNLYPFFQSERRHIRCGKKRDYDKIPPRSLSLFIVIRAYQRRCNVRAYKSITLIFDCLWIGKTFGCHHKLDGK